MFILFQFTCFVFVFNFALPVWKGEFYWYAFVTTATLSVDSGEISVDGHTSAQRARCHPALCTLRHFVPRWHGCLSWGWDGGDPALAKTLPVCRRCPARLLVSVGPGTVAVRYQVTVWHYTKDQCLCRTSPPRTNPNGLCLTVMTKIIFLMC